MNAQKGRAVRPTAEDVPDAEELMRCLTEYGRAKLDQWLVDHAEQFHQRWGDLDMWWYDGGDVALTEVLSFIYPKWPITVRITKENLKNQQPDITIAYTRRRDVWFVECGNHGQVFESEDGGPDAHDIVLMAAEAHMQTDHGGTGVVERSMMLDPEKWERKSHTEGVKVPW